MLIIKDYFNFNKASNKINKRSNFKFIFILNNKLIS